MRNASGKSLSRRERVARVSGPGEGYHSHFFKVFPVFFISVPLTRRFAAPSPVGRRICPKHFAIWPAVSGQQVSLCVLPQTDAVRNDGNSTLENVVCNSIHK